MSPPVPYGMEQANDMVGMTFGRLVVVGKADRVKGQKQKWICKCACGSGREVVTAGYDLMRGKSKSCGCYHRERASDSNRTHGATNTGEHSVWRAIKARCYNPKNKCYHIYGARGIAMCKRWRESFEAFLSDMGKRPSNKHQIDRIDNDGMYEPSNCRWVLNVENSRNRNNNRMVTIDGKAKCLAEWCEIYGVNYHTVHKRMSRSGWDARRALQTPVRKR